MKQILKTLTEVTKSVGNLTIFTYFVDSLDLMKAFISDRVFSQDGTSFIENEEGFTLNGYEDVDFFIDSNGELVINSDDNKTFYINDNCELIMEELE